MSEPEKKDDTMSEQTNEESGKAAAKREKVIKCVSAVLFALIFLLAGITAGWFIGVSSVDSRARNLAWLLERVKDNYYREVDDEALYESLFESLELDKFCRYYNEDEYDALVRESKGQNSGFGVSLTYEGDAVRIYSTVFNSPAELAGLQSGMTIYRFGDIGGTMQAAKADTFFDSLTGKNSVVLEAGFSSDDVKTYQIARASYSAAYCEYRDSEKSYRFRGKDKLTLTEVGEGLSHLDADTAYIRLTEFDGNAADEFETCLQKMRERGRKNLVIDLRLNGGGYLTTLCEIASHLLKNAEGKSPIVATARYRNGDGEVYAATGNDFSAYFSSDSRIRILADENTASASEALMGAMLDYGTVTSDDIYLRVSMSDGEEVARTYGKGVMQSTFVAPDGRALRLTVAEIFWPHGNSIHGVGLRAEGDHAVKADLFASADEFLGML